MEFELIQSLFPKKVEGHISEEMGLLDALYPEERELIIYAIEKRQKEFAAGRLCAKEGLFKLGIINFPILKDGKGAPIWPEGIGGSISHTKGCNGAVVARISKGESLGLDIEKIDRLEEELWEYLFVEEEREWLKTKDDESQKYASILFSAKEAFYKAQYQLTHSWLGFHDVMIELTETEEKFVIHLLIETGKWKKDSKFEGRYKIFSGYVASGVWIG